jgi:nickel transport protein
MARYLLPLLLLAPAPALAHKLNVFAHVDGATIVGRAYFTGDTAARHVDVIARDPSGRELGRAKTDDGGNFTLPVRVRTDHRLTAETPDGHASGAYVVPAAELPGDVPADANLRGQETSRPDSVSTARDAGPAPVGDLASTSARLESMQKQIEFLRQQIDESEQRLRLRDLLGGIGYILGLAGIAAYMKSRQKRNGPA